MDLKKLLFGKKREKYCKNCIYSNTLDYSGEIFCSKKGFVPEFSKCHKYKYDPLKRRPESTAPVSEFTKSDFEL